MLKKYTAIILICISGILYAGHSFIPHHHHAHSEDGTEIFIDDHHHDDHHGTSDDHSGLSDMLAHFPHVDAFFNDSKNPEPTVQIDNSGPTPVFLPYSIKWAEHIPAPVKRTYYHYRYIDYQDLLRIPSGLRAPPVAA